ncbi:MAG: LysM peptidoglycan-binding domain-containing protein [Mollicutes bacterium]|nr:LysM peptidoglycan-binding domain-containing protein [Mollicutes bacterium]
MIIHVVKPGDTLYQISQMYNVDYQKITFDNQIPLDEYLVVGQTLVIIYDPNIKKFREIEVNGYTFPNINTEALLEILPYLTYLCIFSYQVTPEGNLILINDDYLIEVAKINNVIPIMVITNIGLSGRFDSDLAKTILTNEELQNKLIDNVMEIVQEKGYMGLNIDFEYVYPENKELFINFINKVYERLKNNNYLLFVSLAPKIRSDQPGILYEAHDYQAIGNLADRIVLMTYEWGYAGGPARAVAPINLVQRVLDYAITEIPSEKILMGIPNYGYDWILPYIEGTFAKSIGNYEAIEIARHYRQAINYDYIAQTPFFNYYDELIQLHEVWFEDARSIQAKLELPIKYNLAGISYWTINRFFPQNYLVLNSLFDIKK